MKETQFRKNGKNDSRVGEEDTQKSRNRKLSREKKENKRKQKKTKENKTKENKTKGGIYDV